MKSCTECCMLDCTNKINPEKDFLWIEDEKNDAENLYICKSCLDKIGDE